MNEDQVRQKVVQCHDRSYFIRAGAGAGKTTLIVDKVVNIIQKKKAKNIHLAVITFTNQAAGELKSRIQKKLSNQKDSYHIDLITDLFIGTIHSFCAEVLPICCVQLGRDENIEVMTEQESQRLWQEYIKEELKKDTELNKLREYGCCNELIIESGWLVSESGSSLKLSSEVYEWPKMDQVWESLEEVLESIPSECGQDNISMGIKYWRQNRQRHIQTLYQFANYTKVKDWRFRSWPYLQEAKEYCQKLEQWQQEQWRPFEMKLSRVLYQQVGQKLKLYKQRYQAWKQKQGRYSFQDILTEVRDLVSQNKSCREQVNKRYKSFIVDELQDTDKVQAEIILNLIKGKEGASIWEKELIGGGLCVVGDPQQSIYRFRGSDMELYSYWQEIFKRSSDGEQVTLEKNFRTQKNIGVQLNNYYEANWKYKEGIQPPYQELNCQKGGIIDAGVWYYPQVKGTKREQMKYQSEWIQQEFLDKRDQEELKTVLILASTNQECHNFQMELKRLANQGTRSIKLGRDIAQEFTHFIKAIYYQEEEQNRAYWGWDWDRELKSQRIAELKMKKDKNIVDLWNTFCRWLYPEGMNHPNQWSSMLWEYHEESLAEVIDDMDQKLQERKKGQASISSNVRCMTIHQSKGLEADAVVLLNHRQRRYQPTACIVDYAKDYLNLSFKQLGKLVAKKHYLTGVFFPAIAQDYEQLQVQEQAKEQAEQQRLSYVALTRAKKVVLIPDIREDKVSYWSDLGYLVNQVKQWGV